MARAIGISVCSVRAASGERMASPHRMRHFNRSKDPGLRPKLRAIVGLHVDPPAHAVVLSAVEKSQILPRVRSGVDRTQPGLPLKKGRAGNMTAQRARRHHHRPQHAAPPPPGVIRFLNAIQAAVPAGKLVHVILDNYAAHKNPKDHRLARPPSALHLPHFTPTSCSWLSAVETFFATLPSGD